MVFGLRHTGRIVPGLQVGRGVRVTRHHPGTRLVLGRNVRLFSNVALFLDAPGAVIEIGDGTFLNDRCEIRAQQRVSIGAGCAIAWDVHVIDSNFHPVGGECLAMPVTIADRVWVGKGATLLPGVTVGRGAIVGAMALVRSDVPPTGQVVQREAVLVREGVVWG